MIAIFLMSISASEQLFLQKIFEGDKNGLTSLVSSGFNYDFIITGNYLTGRHSLDITAYFPHHSLLSEEFYRKNNEFYQYSINYGKLIDIIAFDMASVHYYTQQYESYLSSGIIPADSYEIFLNELLKTSSNYIEVGNFLTAADQEKLPNMQSVQTLTQAIRLCDFKKVEQILQTGIDVNSISYFSLVETPLTAALTNSCFDHNGVDISKVKSMVELLLKYGADLHYPIPVKSTFSREDVYFMPSYQVVLDSPSIHLKELFLFLKEKGANLNALNSNGKHFLSYFFGNKMIRDIHPVTFDDFQFFIDNGVDVNIKNPRGEFAISLPLDILDYKVSMQLMDLFKSKGFEFNTTSFLDRFNNPFTRHLIGALYGFYELDQDYFWFLKDVYLKYSPNSLNEKNGYYERTPIMDIMFAFCQTTNQAQYQYPIKYQHIRDFNTRARDYYEYFLELLKNSEFDPNLSDKDGIDTLTYAINLCPYEVVDILVKKGARMDLVDFEDKFNILKESVYPAQYAPIVIFNGDERNEMFFNNL